LSQMVAGRHAHFSSSICPLANPPVHPQPELLVVVVLVVGLFENRPFFVNHKMTRTIATVTRTVRRTMSHPMHLVRRRFLWTRSSQDSVCFMGGLDPFDVPETVSGRVFFSSSRCTAVEKRFQNAGSRTLAMVED